MAEQKKSTTSRKKSTAAEPKAAPVKAAAPKKTAAKTATPKKAAPRSKKTVTAAVNEEMRQHMIREAAYYRAMQRGFGNGAEMEDWCIAEREIDAMLGKLTG